MMEVCRDRQKSTRVLCSNSSSDDMDDATRCFNQQGREECKQQQQQWYLGIFLADRMDANTPPTIRCLGYRSTRNINMSRIKQHSNAFPFTLCLMS